MSYTAGPWTVSLDYDPEGFKTGYARVVTPNHTDPEEGWVSDYVSEADARLIAAAPELLESAKRLVVFAELALGCIDFPEQAPGRFTECSEAISKAHATIAKAEGAQ